MTLPTAHVLTYGCQMNDVDSESISERLVQLGFTFVPEWRDAELLVFNTCAIRENASTRVAGVLGHVQTLKRENPEKVVAIHGCLAAHEPDELQRRAPWVDILVTTNRIDDLLDQVQRAFPDLDERLGKAGGAGSQLPDETPFRRMVPIMRGCDFFCTFCVVPAVRGKERYFSPDEVLGRLAALQAEGAREVTLLGQNVNSYRYREVDFPGLLDLAAERFPALKLRYTTSNPWDFSDRLAEVMGARENVAKMLHLPVQSGSDRILVEMNRQYTADAYLEMVRRLRARVPGVALTTDIIAGFPGETEADHQATLDLMDAVRFDSAFMFHYSPRAGTPAADFPDQLPLKTRKARLREIIDLQIEHSREANARHLGEVALALVEGPARKSPGMVAARRDDNKTVLFEGELDALRGAYVPVRVTKADAFTLMGEAAGAPLPVPEVRPAKVAAPAESPVLHV